MASVKTAIQHAGYSLQKIIFKNRKYNMKFVAIGLFLKLQIFDFSLSETEMKAIEGLNKNTRFVELLM